MPATDDEQESRRANWHQSSVDTVLGCQRRYALEYEVGLTVPGKQASSIGTAVHAGLEAHEVARAAGVTLTLPEVQAAALASLTVERLRLDPSEAADEDLAAEMRVLTEQTCENWWSGPMTGPQLPAGWEGSARDFVLTLQPVATETYVRAAVLEGTAPLAGTLDGLYRTADGTLVMLDWKTAKSLSGWKSPDEHRHQAAFYAAILALGGGYDLTVLPAMIYVVVRRGKVRAGSPTSAMLTVQPDAYDLVELGKRVRKAEAYKDAGVYVANPSWRWCSTCPFRQLCAPGSGVLLGPIENLAGHAGDGWRKALPLAA